MSLPAFTPAGQVDLPSQTLLLAVDAFLDAHYEFRCKDKYKDFFGRIRADFGKHEAEERETLETGERHYIPAIPPGTQFSDPWGWTLYSFSTELMRLIDAKGKDSVEVYKRAGMDRKLFSKIRSQPDYIPSKKTIIALALALELSLDETQALLERAGFTLSRSILFDVIIEYFISQGKYDIHEINNVLFAYKQPTLG